MKNLSKILKKGIPYIQKIIHKTKKLTQFILSFLQRFFSQMRVSRQHKLLTWKELAHLGLFSFLFVYYELLLRLFNHTGLFSHIMYPILFGIAFGFLFNCFNTLFIRRINRNITIFLMIFVAIFFITECLVKNTFQVYMPIASILTGATGVATGFTSDLLKQIFSGFFVIFFYILPTFLYYFFTKKHTLSYQYRWPAICMNFCIFLIIFCFSITCSTIGSTKKNYKTQYEFNKATETFGLLTSLRLEQIRDTSTLVIPTEQEEVEVKEYDKNVCDIDFEQLAAQENDETFQEMDTYISQLTPSSQNEYTGLFEGKNLILICAEAFSDAVISKELTPTLYRMSHNGFYFSDYYQLTWGGSTSTGEFSFLFGLVPTDGVNSIQDTIGHNNYYTLGNQLQRLGYYSQAYHNGSYTFYSRDLTHENLGYSTYLGTGNGLEDIAHQDYPNDEIMMDTTFDTYVDKQPFSIYYMTVSGHSGYYANSAFVQEHLDTVLEKTNGQYKDVVNYYLCYQLELEEALTTLIQNLEEAGIADDTVICMTADHYPYGLEDGIYGNTENYTENLYGHAINNKRDQDHNSLIIWSGCLENEYKDMVCEIDTPTYSLDIVPTLSNLFGLDYDSRLLVGRDVFSNQTPIVIWNDYSWLSEKGYYSSSTGEFICNEGMEVDSDYIDKMSLIAQNRINFSSQVLATDYYAHLFGPDEIVDSTPLWQEKYGTQ